MSSLDLYLSLFCLLDPVTPSNFISFSLLDEYLNIPSHPQLASAKICRNHGRSSVRYFHTSTSGPEFFLKLSSFPVGEEERMLIFVTEYWNSGESSKDS